MRHRVLFVDDSALTRQLVGDALASAPGIELAGTAANGRIALGKVDQLHPDIVVLDVEMPDMDGISTLQELRRRHPRIPVIMFSALTERGAVATLDALAAGAVDYVTKPSTSSAEEARRVIRDELGMRIRAILGEDGFTDADPSPRAEARSIIAVGASTGGPDAVARLLVGLPADLALPVVVVQHMPPIFTRLFCRRLARAVPLPVREAEDRAPVEPGTVYLAPGGHQTAVTADDGELRFRVWEGRPENSCRPSVDVLFRSVARACGRDSLAVVLTGMGRDGITGAAAIRQAGGCIFAQDRSSSVVWGMPGLVVQSGLAERVHDPEGLAHEIVAWLRTREARA